MRDLAKVFRGKSKRSKNERIPENYLKDPEMTKGTLDRLASEVSELGRYDDKSTAKLSEKVVEADFADGRIGMETLNSYDGKLRSDSDLAEPAKDVDFYARTMTPLLSDPTVQKLFRIFLLLSTKEPSENILNISQKIHKDEVELVLTFILRHLGFKQPYRCGADDALSSLEANQETDFTFKQFLLLLPELVPVDKPVYAQAVAEIYDELINQVFMKGCLSKKSGRSPVGSGYKRFWCYALPGRLLYFASRHASRPVSQTILNGAAQISEISSTSSGAPCFTVKLGEKTITFMADSEIDRLQWMWAVRLAKERSSHCTNYHRELFLQRHKLRATPLPPKSLALAQSNTAPSPSSHALHLTSLEESFQYLQSENLNLHKLLLLRDTELEKERERCEQFQLERDELTRQLLTEKQATKDEEIVRMIATRMLEDERAKNDELEEQLTVRCKDLRRQHSLRESAERRLEDLKADLKAMELDSLGTTHHVARVDGCDLISGHTNMTFMDDANSEGDVLEDSNSLDHGSAPSTPSLGLPFHQPKSILKKTSSLDTSSSSDSA